jgi:putative hydrolase of the HAD superfamily
MAIKNVVFDLGGVIIDLDTQRAFRRFEEIGIGNARELLDPYEQKGIFLELENGTIDAESFRRKLSDYVGRELTGEDITYAWMGFMADVPQYKLDYLAELRKKYKVYILSNTNPVVMSWLKSGVFSPAGKPLAVYCDKVYTSFEIGLTKPDPRIFEFMLADAGITPAETLFVDDGERNIKTALSLGMYTCHPRNGEDWRPAVQKIIMP